jgi:uroporphyrinogen decarboxylase
MRQPDFQNFLDVIKGKNTGKVPLFEFIINDDFLRYFAGEEIVNQKDELTEFRIALHGFKNAGYDFCAVPQWHTNTLKFVTKEHTKLSSISSNAGALITDRESFEKYEWPDPEKGDYSILDKIAAEMPEGMKLLVFGPLGVLELAVEIVGYENLCIMTLMDEELTAEIFDNIGKRLLRFYELCLEHDSVGAIVGNDDWGFKTQTLLDHDTLRKYVFPWHKKIVAAAHAKGKPAILHSCGNLVEIMYDIMYDMKYDAKHSYEDGIVPVEEAYKRWGDRITIVGGIDMDFLTRSTPEQVTERCKNLLELTKPTSRYIMGAGNSIPHFVPLDNYNALRNSVE